MADETVSGGWAWRIIKRGVAALLTLWAGVRFTLDMIGRGALIEDSDHTLNLVEKALNWVFSTPWWVPAILVTLLVLVLLFQGRASQPMKSASSSSPQTSPIEIIFDPTNPAKRFWSFESPRDEQGNKKPGIFWEYRVDIKNNSSKTIRNVSATIEHIGRHLPLRPTDPIFEEK